MTEEIFFKKCLIFLTVLPRDAFRNPTKGLWRNVFAKIVNYF